MKGQFIVEMKVVGESRSSGNSGNSGNAVTYLTNLIQCNLSVGRQLVKRGTTEISLLVWNAISNFETCIMQYVWNAILAML